MHLQPLLPLPPVRHRSIQKVVERCSVIVFDEVTEFVGDDVVDAGWACLDQLEIQQDAAFFGATAPAAFHEADTPHRASKVSKTRKRQAILQASLEELLSMLAVPGFQKLFHGRGTAFVRCGDFEESTDKLHTARFALRNPKAVLSPEVAVSFSVYESLRWHDRAKRRKTISLANDPAGSASHLSLYRLNRCINRSFDDHTSVWLHGDGQSLARRKAQAEFDGLTAIHQRLSTGHPFGHACNHCGLLSRAILMQPSRI